MKTIKCIGCDKEKERSKQHWCFCQPCADEWDELMKALEPLGGLIVGKVEYLNK